jgi:hypothetical protein
VRDPRRAREEAAVPKHIPGTWAREPRPAGASDTVGGFLVLGSPCGTVYGRACWRKRQLSLDHGLSALPVALAVKTQFPPDGETVSLFVHDHALRSEVRTAVSFPPKTQERT